MNLQTLCAVALCEMRSCSRLARTWVIMIFAFLIATVGYLVVCGQHMLTSTAGPAIQIPRFIVGESAAQFVGIFALGIIFLAFDIRARDVRDRISGIIDAKPVSNLELVVGRLSGILILLCIPLFLFIFLVLLHGFLAGAFGWSYGAPIEIWSVISFLVWDLVPQLAWWGGLVMLLAVVLRNRLLVALGAFGLYLLMGIWIPTQLSWDQLEIAGAVLSQVVYPSDVAPVFAKATITFQRVAMVLLSIGMLVGAAALLSRHMSRRVHFIAASVITFGLGIALIMGLFSYQSLEPKQKSAWLEIHQNQDTSSFPDVKSLEGSVEIKPGNRIKLNLSLTVTPPRQNATNQVTFTLNPAYKIKKIELDSNQIDDYTFSDDGLLTIPANHFGNDSVILQIECSGKPNPQFAYLDANIDLAAASVMDFSVAMARFLGNNSYIFRSDFVALLPGVSWYPTAGVAIGRDDPQNYPKDHFSVDLSVTVPKNWRVAGPGKSEVQPNGNGKSTFQFRPNNPVVDVVLVASNFERAAITVQDIEFELLYSAKHRNNFKAMEPIVSELENWIVDRLAIAEKYGLEYPYEALTLVEVPSHLRVLGGGWRMASTLYGPGVVMIRETGIPTSRFDVKFKDQDAEESLQDLIDYVDNDYQSGNLLNAITSNFVSYQTSPMGQGANALQFFVEDIVGDLIVERLPYFTTNTALSPIGGTQVAVANDGASTSVTVGVGNTNRPSRRSGGGSMILRNRNTHNLSVWSTIEEHALAELNFHEEPLQSYHAVLLRNTYAIAALKDWEPEVALSNILGDLVHRFRGRNYTYEEFLETAKAHEPRFNEITQNFITSNLLPGYLTSDPIVEKVPAEDPNTEIFQTVFNLRNAESVPGVVTVHWDEEQAFGSDENGVTLDSLDPLLVEPNSSYQFAIQSNLKPTQLTIEAPMSLNRDPINLKIPVVDEAELSVASSLPVTTPSQWNPTQPDQIIVDDLDHGFVLSGTPEEMQLPWFVPNFVAEIARSFAGQNELDRGLPSYSHWNSLAQWTRFQGSGFGRYRNTFTRVPRVSEDHSDEAFFGAEFVATLPNSGKWALEYSVPGRILMEQILLSYQNQENIDSNEEEQTDSDDNQTLTLVVQIDDQEIPLELDPLIFRNEFDTSSLESDFKKYGGRRGSIPMIISRNEHVAELSYWAALGSFDIKHSSATVKTSNKSSILDTFADAIRWTYVGEGESE